MTQKPISKGIIPMLNDLPINFHLVLCDAPANSLVATKPMRNIVAKRAAPTARLEAATIVTVLTVTVETTSLKYLYDMA